MKPIKSTVKLATAMLLSHSISHSDRKQVFVGETEISLTLKEYQLLEYFIMNQNQVLTKEMIMENIWESIVNSLIPTQLAL